ncbi:hypothetical protein L7F22_032250 [Adiantum nelumboides]|nr:hypothetical protein [Adiantum nelumboides]
MHLHSGCVLEHEHIESVFVYIGAYYPSKLGSEPLAGTQGSATQDPHIAASDSSFDFDVMEGYPMQQHLESLSQDMHALGQPPSSSMFSHLKETLSRATRSKHATNEINEGDGEVDSSFTSQIDPVLFESAHGSTPITIPIGPLKLTPLKTLLHDDRSLAKVQEVERYIFAARENEIESLCKAEQHQAILAKAPITSVLPANPLQSPELTALKSQTIGSHIASASRDTSNTSILDGVFLNENWEYNLQTEKLTDLYTSYTHHVSWLDVIQVTSNSTSVDKQQCDVIHSIVQMERQNPRVNMPSMGPMRFLDIAKAKQPTISQMKTPLVSPMDPSYIVLPGVLMQSEPTHGSFSFHDLVQPSLGDLPIPTMNMTRGARSTSMASTTPLYTSVAPMHTSVAPMPIPVSVHQPYVPVATHPYVALMSPPNPIAYVPQSHYPSPYFSGAVPASINTSYPTSLKLSLHDAGDPADVTLYQTAVGCLIYVCNTRPDIQFAVSQGGSLSQDLHAFLDSDWAGCFDTRVSTSGFFFMLGSSCISWLSKKQPTMATSSCETEYKAVFTATIECVWLRCLMADLGVGQDTANTIYTDSQSALAVARNLVFHARTKHIKVHYHYVRERLSAREISLAYVPTQNNLADLFTKALSREKLEAFRKALGLLSFVD